MESMQPSTISVIEPFSKAIEKTRAILFRPFDLKKWCLIGFCAWLAMLGEGGGGGGGGKGHVGGGFQDGGGGMSGEEVKTWLESNPPWLIVVIAGIVLFILLLAIILLWLRSRGKFMFLHCIALNRAEIAAPWRIYAEQGNSLFLFTLAAGAAVFLCVLPCIALIVFAAFLIGKAKVVAGGVLLIIFAVLLLIGIGIGFTILLKLTHDFVVPIMALRYCRVTAAWKEFMGLLKVHKGNFALYLLFQIVIVLVIGFVVGAFTVLTYFFSILITVLTCCLCCLFIIPLGSTYVCAVLFLPLFTFARSYSLFYLAQYGAAYDVFTAGREAAVREESGGFVGGNGI